MASYWSKIATVSYSSCNFAPAFGVTLLDFRRDPWLKELNLKTTFSTTTRAHFFSERVINVWNALPADVIDFGSVKKFRCSLLKVDLSCFTKCS